MRVADSEVGARSVATATVSNPPQQTAASSRHISTHLARARAGHHPARGALVAHSASRDTDFAGHRGTSAGHGHAITFRPSCRRHLAPRSCRASTSALTIVSFWCRTGPMRQRDAGCLHRSQQLTPAGSASAGFARRAAQAAQTSTNIAASVDASTRSSVSPPRAARYFTMASVEARQRVTSSRATASSIGSP